MDCTVVRLRQDDKGWVIRTTEDTVTAATVVVATGANPRPRIPHFRSPLSADIVQMHSGEYRNPEALPDGDVLVVGAGTSGAQIALELSRTHAVRIAGRPTPHVPDLVLRRAGAAYWFLVDSVLTRDTPVGRKAAQGFMTRGAPLISVSMKDLTDAGVTPVGRVVDVVDGGLGLADGPTVHPATVLWATGYRPDFGWIDQLACDPYGWPLQRRGVAQGAPGLFFLGVPFQYAQTSALIGGVGRDASYIADRITGGDGC
jgi:putative flavoprotein involved in K+ transport